MKTVRWGWAVVAVANVALIFNSNESVTSQRVTHAVLALCALTLFGNLKG